MRDRNNKDKVRCSVPAHRVNGLFQGAFPPSCLKGEKRGAGGASGPEHQVQRCWLSRECHTSTAFVLATCFSEIHIIQGCRDKVHDGLEKKKKKSTLNVT